MPAQGCLGRAGRVNPVTEASPRQPSKGSCGKYHLLGGPFGCVITYNLGRFYNIPKKARIPY